MKLQVQSYNNGGSAYNAEAEETKFRTYSLEHEFGKPARAIITLADVDGAMMRKYNADDNDVYLGVGKITIEDPTGTDVFFGRIMRATGDSAARTLTLECLDWLSQLDEELITYDFREDLDGSGLRQSEAHADADAAVYLVDAGIKTLFSAQADDGGAITDETIGANEDTDDDMTLWPAVPAFLDKYNFGFESKVSQVEIYVSQTTDADISALWQYWDGDSWETLPGQSDGTDNFHNAGLNTVSWTVPGDWAKVVVNGVNAYWVRNRITVLTDPGTQGALGRRAWAEYYFYDDDMAWDTTPGNAQNFDGMFLLFTVGMAGTNTWRFFPYDGFQTGGAAYADNHHELWDDNDLTDRGFLAGDFLLTYPFRVHLGNNSPSDFYVHDSISCARIEVVWNILITGAGNHSHLQFDDVTDGFIDLQLLLEIDHFHRTKFDLNIDETNVLVDSDGIATIQFDVDRSGGSADLQIKYLHLEVDVETTAYSSPVSITETEANRIRVSTDLTAAATRIWEQIPYCIAQPKYKHIDSDETPGSLITDGDGIVPLTCAATIEHTTGISTRKHKDVTRLQILQTEAADDKASFWIELGTTTVTYKKTFGADTMQLTDATVDSWQLLQDYSTIKNLYDVYGVRIGDSEIYQQSQTAASITKFKATRSKVIRNTGLVTDADAKAIGEALTARDSDVKQMVGCTITGNTATAAHATTIKLGEIVEITSSYLWSTAAKDYIVTRWAYDSTQHKTFLTMHPKVSIGITAVDTPTTQGDKIQDKLDEVLPEVADNITQVL